MALKNEYVVKASHLKVNITGAGAAIPSDFTIGTLPPPVWNPADQTELWVFVPVTPPSDGTADGGHIYVRIPADSVGGGMALDGSTPLDGTSDLQGGFNAGLDMGNFPYVADAQPWIVKIPGADKLILGPTDIRVRVVAVSGDVDPAPTAATPSAVVTALPYSAAKSGSGVEYEPLVTAVTAKALPDVPIGGHRRTPVVVSVSLAGLPVPLPSDFGYELVLTNPGEDPNAVNRIATGVERVDGMVPAGPDEYSTPHSLLLFTVTTLTTVTVWARSVKVVDGKVVARNTIVPGLTPSAKFDYGTVLGVLDLGTALLTSVTSGLTIGDDGTLQVHNGSGIAFDGTGKITVNDGIGLGIDGSGFLIVKTGTALAADGTGVYIPGGAITNALLATLAVAAANIQDAAVATAKLADGSVSTSKIISAQITTALIANAAITNALLGTAVVGTANIQNAAITNALIANLAVGTAHIQDGSITNAKIGTMSVDKLTAATATFFGTVTLQVSGGGKLVLNSTSVELTGIGSSPYKITLADFGMQITGPNDWPILYGGGTVISGNRVFSGQYYSGSSGGMTGTFYQDGGGAVTVAGGLIVGGL